MEGANKDYFKSTLPPPLLFSAHAADHRAAMEGISSDEDASGRGGYTGPAPPPPQLSGGHHSVALDVSSDEDGGGRGGYTGPAPPPPQLSGGHHSVALDVSSEEDASGRGGYTGPTPPPPQLSGGHHSVALDVSSDEDGGGRGGYTGPAPPPPQLSGGHHSVALDVSSDEDASGRGGYTGPAPPPPQLSGGHHSVALDVSSDEDASGRGGYTGPTPPPPQLFGAASAHHRTALDVSSDEEGSGRGGFLAAAPILPQPFAFKSVGARKPLNSPNEQTLDSENSHRMNTNENRNIKYEPVSYISPSLLPSINTPLKDKKNTSPYGRSSFDRQRSSDKNITQPTAPFHSTETFSTVSKKNGRSITKEIRSSPKNSSDYPLRPQKPKKRVPVLSSFTEELHIPKEISPSTLLKRESDQASFFRKQQKLPLSHLYAHHSFKQFCENKVDNISRDWNEEFQYLCRMQGCFGVLGGEFHVKLNKFLGEYEAFAKKLVESYFQDSSKIRDAISRSSDYCVRMGNLVIRLWKDAKLGMNMQRCLSTVFILRPPNLHVPLTATFRYFEVSISVQAMVPLGSDAKPIYRGDGGFDLMCDIPLREYLQCLLNRINVSLTTSEKLANVSGLEVYKGLDAKYYVLNALGVLPPLKQCSGKAVPLRRLGSLIFNPGTNTYFPPPVLNYKKRVSVVQYALLGLSGEVKENRFEKLISILHYHHFNVCLLGLIVQSLSLTEKDDIEENITIVVETICIEMVCRALRHSMFEEASSFGSHLSLQHFNLFLIRAVGRLVECSPKDCISGLLPFIEESFVFERGIEKGLVLHLEKTVGQHKESITKRLCQLCNIQLTGGQVSLVIARPSSHNFSSFFSESFSDFSQRIILEPKAFPQRLRTVLVMPLQIEYYCQSDRIHTAWKVVKDMISELGNDNNDQFYKTHMWCLSAIVAARVGESADALRLVEKARLVMDSVSAYTVMSRVGRTYLPSYPFYVSGQIAVLQFEGFVYCFLKDYSNAEKSGDSALSAMDNYDTRKVTQTAPIRDELMMLFVEIAANCPTEADLIRIDNLWESERDPQRFSLLSSRINEMFGFFFLRKKLYPQAALRLTACLTGIERIFGGQSASSAETLNKLGFVYYCWDVVKFGTVCSCLLHQAEDIMISVYGRYSTMHLAVLENIIVMFIERKMFTSASIRLHIILKLPPRYAARIPKDHPTMTRLNDIWRKLQELYCDSAARMIQKIWKEYAHNVLLRSARETSAFLVQRVGRAFIVRRAFNALLYGIGNIDTIERKQQMYEFSSSSKPLLIASTMFDKGCRNWNGDFQRHRMFDSWITPTEGKLTLRLLTDMEVAFHDRATHYVTLYERAELNYIRVPGCDNSFLFDNIVFTKIALNAFVPTLLNDLYKHIRSELLTTVTAPLSTIVNTSIRGYMATALLPLRRQPEFIITCDGREGPKYSQSSYDLIVEMLKGMRTSKIDQKVEGLEVIRGAENLCYVTNALGLVVDPLSAKYDGPPISELPHSFFFDCILLCIDDKAKVAIDNLEKYILSENRASIIGVYETLLRFINFLVFSENSINNKRLFKALEFIEEGDLILPAILGLYLSAKVVMFHEEYKQSWVCLNNAFNLLKKVRLHAFFASFIVLECGSLLQQLSTVNDKRIEPSSLALIHNALRLGEPSSLLFVTFEKFIRFHKRYDEFSTANALSEVRYTRVRQLSPQYVDGIIADLSKQDDLQLIQDPSERQRESQLYLTTSIHLVKVHKDRSKDLGVLLTKLAALLITMNDLSNAQKSLHHAYDILNAEAPYGPEMQIWRKFHRTLKIKMKEKAIDVIRRAVRRWRERRQAEMEMKVTKPAEFDALQLVRKMRRLNHLTVAESRARVYIVDAETEEWYQLQRRNRRSRNEAMVKEFIRLTYGRRVEIFNEKVQSALSDSVDYAMQIKFATFEFFSELMMKEFVAFRLKEYQIGRRDIIAEWHTDRARVKCCRMELIEMTARDTYQQARNRFIAGLLELEEKTWRKVIVSNYGKSKNKVFRYVARKLNIGGDKLTDAQKSKKRYLDEKALIIDEERKRERIMQLEENAFRLFIFGPEVQSDED